MTKTILNATKYGVIAQIEPNKKVRVINAENKREYIYIPKNKEMAKRQQEIFDNQTDFIERFHIEVTERKEK